MDELSKDNPSAYRNTRYTYSPGSAGNDVFMFESVCAKTRGLESCHVKFAVSVMAELMVTVAGLLVPV